MIAFLRGKVGSRTGNAVAVDVNGVGYLVQASARSLNEFGEVGNDIFVFVHTQVREDAISLFGFADDEERDIFLMLIGVQGVGPKVALAILSVMAPGQVVAALSTDDRVALCTADGVGAKLATRLVTELKAKAVQAGGAMRGLNGLAPPSRLESVAVSEARSGLASLGFQKSEIQNLLAAVLSGDSPPSDTGSIVAACLRQSQNRVAA
jgi:Holliday junction DNA helicase RuvA